MIGDSFPGGEERNFDREVADFDGAIADASNGGKSGKKKGGGGG